MSDPKRFCPSGYWDGNENVACADIDPDGDYVLFSDYEAMRKERDELNGKVEEHEDFMAFMKGSLSEFECCHEKGEHDSTPPFMWPELIGCIVRKAVQDVTKERNELKVELEKVKATLDRFRAEAWGTNVTNSP